eukprot:Skav230707  [mRNA]  locus=scaffold1495:475891:476130:- [translate_table: standard]
MASNGFKMHALNTLQSMADLQDGKEKKENAPSDQEDPKVDEKPEIDSASSEPSPSEDMLFSDFHYILVGDTNTLKREQE